MFLHDGLVFCWTMWRRPGEGVRILHAALVGGGGRVGHDITAVAADRLLLLLLLLRLLPISHTPARGCDVQYRRWPGVPEQHVCRCFGSKPTYSGLGEINARRKRVGLCVPS